MTVTTATTAGARHILLRLAEPARLPDTILGTLRDEVVLAGWLRATGVLADVQLRALDPTTASFARARRISGPVQVVTLEGSIALSAGDVSCGLRAVLARETDAGLETIAGELVDARILSLEVLVLALDDLPSTPSPSPSPSQTRQPADVSATAPTPVQNRQPADISAAAPPAPAPVQNRQPADVSAAAPSPAPAPAPKPSPTFSSPTALPLRPVRPPQPEEEEQLLPEAGDVVEHFAFGRCEVVKTDGDRLHVRLGKDGRIKEIALEMLKVTPLPLEDGQSSRHYKLARKL